MSRNKSNGQSSSKSNKKGQLPPSHPQENYLEHRQFLIRSMERNDVDLAAVMELNRSLIHAKATILESCGELILLDLGQGRLTLINDELHERDTTSISPPPPLLTTGTRNDTNTTTVTTTTTTTKKEQDTTTNKTSTHHDNNNSSSSRSNTSTTTTTTTTPYHLTPKQKEVCVDFLLRMKLRRKLLNRLARRLNRLAHALDGEDIAPPAPPKYGDLRLHIDPAAVQAFADQEQRHEAIQQLLVQYKQKVQQQQQQQQEQTEEKQNDEQQQQDDTNPQESIAGDNSKQQQQNEDGTANDTSQQVSSAVANDSTTLSQQQQEDSKIDKPDAVQSTKTPDNTQSSSSSSFSPDAMFSSIPPPTIDDINAIKSYYDAYEKVWDPTTSSFHYTMNDDNDQDTTQTNTNGHDPKFGAGIGATNRSMSAREREAEHKRWSTAVLGRIPEQTTFQELGLIHRVFYLQERRNWALEREKDSPFKEKATLGKEENDDEEENDDDCDGSTNSSPQTPKRKLQLDDVMDDKETMSDDDDQEEEEKETEPKTNDGVTKMQIDDEDDDKSDTDDESSNDDGKKETSKRTDEKEDDKAGDDEDDDMESKNDEDEDETKDDKKTKESKEDSDKNDNSIMDVDTDRKKNKDSVDTPEETTRSAKQEQQQPSPPPEEPKRKRPMSLVPVPSFYEQDLKRVRMLHADLMAASIHEHARRRLTDVTRDYNNAFRVSNDLFDRRQRVQQQLTTFMYESRAKMSKLKNDYALEVAIARSRWQKTKHDHDVNRAKAALPSHWGRSPLGTAATHNYCRSSGMHQIIGTCVADLVDGAILIAEKQIPNEKYDDFKPPPAPDFNRMVNSQTGETLAQQQMRVEGELRRELNSLTTKFQSSEEDRKRAWRKMLKTKAEFELPHVLQQQSGSQVGGVTPKRNSGVAGGAKVDVNLSNYQSIPLPPLRSSTQQTMPQEFTVARAAVASYTPPPRTSHANPEAACSESKYSAARVRERIGADGSVAPVSEPKKTKDGLYQRPAGRTRKGMQWDAIRGIWVPEGTLH